MVGGIVAFWIGLIAGCLVTAWHKEQVKKAAWAEAQMTEHWKRQYDQLQYLVRGVGLDDPFQPLQLGGEDAAQWTERGAVRKTRIRKGEGA